MNCGTGKDGSKAVQLVDEDAQSKTTSENVSTEQSGNGNKLLKIVGGIFCAFIALLVVFMFWTEEKGVTVESHSWERSIAIEKYQRVKESNWKDKVPIRGSVDRCYEKKRSTKKVEDGQTCKTKKKDNGDGSYREVEECKTKYKEIPVMGQWCEYRIDKWKKSRDAKTNGADLLPMASNLNGIQWINLVVAKEEKSQSYIVHLSFQGNKHDVISNKMFGKKQKKELLQKWNFV